MKQLVIKIEKPEEVNFILGQSHFIKTVEDLYEIMVGSVPNAKFGIGFCEASGACLVRIEGNDEALKEVAKRNALKIGAGHTFVIVLKDAFPINVLNAVKMCQEVAAHNASGVKYPERRLRTVPPPQSLF